MKKYVQAAKDIAILPLVIIHACVRPDKSC